MRNVEVITDQKGARKLKVGFSLWPNDKREKDTHPNVKGWDKESGVSAVAWTKNHNGQKFLSGSIEIPLDSLPPELMAVSVMNKPGTPVDLNDDIPF